MEKLGGVPPGIPPGPLEQIAAEARATEALPTHGHLTPEGLTARQVREAENLRQPGGDAGVTARAMEAQSKINGGLDPGAVTLGDIGQVLIPTAAEGMGAAAAAAESAGARQAFAAADAALSAYFTYQAGKGAAKGVVAAKHAYDQGDYLGMVRQLTGAGISTAFGWWAGTNAAKRYGEVADIAAMKNALQDRVNAQYAAEAKTGPPQIAGPAEPPAGGGAPAEAAEPPAPPAPQQSLSFTGPPPAAAPPPATPPAAPQPPAPPSNIGDGWTVNPVEAEIAAQERSAIAERQPAPAPPGEPAVGRSTPPPPPAASAQAPPADDGSDDAAAALAAKPAAPAPVAAAAPPADLGKGWTAVPDTTATRQKPDSNPPVFPLPARAFGEPVTVLGLADDFDPYKSARLAQGGDVQRDTFLVQKPDGSRSLMLGSSIYTTLTPVVPPEDRRFGQFERVHAQTLAGLPQAPQAPSATPPPAAETAMPRGPGFEGRIPTGDIQLDPTRFQFKQEGIGQHGVGDQFKDVKTWDPDIAGTVHVWRDPADGLTYAVNGHHRTELAQRLNTVADQSNKPAPVPEMQVRYLDAATAPEARAKGALINIAEGNGTAIDAAKFFRDTGKTPDMLAAEGKVSLRKRVAQQGAALSQLSDPIFHDVVHGLLPVERAAALGAGVPNHADQQALYTLMRQREAAGKRLTDDQVSELIRLNQRTSTVTENRGGDEQGGLFGVEEMTRSLLPEKATVSDYVRKQLGAEKKLFGAVSTQAAADRLGAAGNVIRAGVNAQTAESANQGSALYDKLSTKAGPIDGILDRAAQSLSKGEDANGTKQAAYREIRDYLEGQLDSLTGVLGRGDSGVEGRGEERPRETGPGQPNPLDTGGAGVDDSSAARALPGGEAAVTARLPHKLAGAKPRYAYGDKQFDLSFANDIDRAAYITAQKTPSKEDAGYLKFAMDATGLSEPQVRAHGEKVRAAIKAMAATAKPGALRVAPVTISARGEASVKAPNALQQAVQRNKAAKKAAPAPHGGTAEAISTPPQSSLVSPEAETESRAAQQSRADKLTGERLTAQFKSGGPVKPSKLKPAENRGLFDEETPESGDLFGNQRGSFSRKMTPAQQLAAADKQYGANMRQWFSARRDLWAARVRQQMDLLRKELPATVDREGLYLMRDMRNHPGEMQQYLAGTHGVFGTVAHLGLAQQNIAKLKPAIDRALNPTPAMLKADAVLTRIAEVSLREGQRLGFIDQHVSPDEYVTHLLEPAGEKPSLVDLMGKALGGKIGRNFPYNQERIFPTILEAIAHNQRPKTLDALKAFDTYGDKFATARATHMLINQLRDSNTGIWGSRSDKNIPRDWVEIAPHAHAFRDPVAYLDAAGQPASAYRTLFVPRKIEQGLRPITDPDYSNKIAGFSNLRMYQAYTKAAQLGLSFFHATTENYMALANMGARGWLKGLKADRDAPHFLEAEADFIAHGGTTSVQGRSYEAAEGLTLSSLPTAGEAWRSMAGVRHVYAAAKAITDLTFGKLQRQFKVVDYSLHKAAWLAKNKTAMPSERTAAMRSIAKELNAVYGGLHWENLGINKVTANVARALMLAPDWTFSNVFNLKYAAEKGTPAGKMARMFWLRAIVGGMAATQLMSMLISGKLSKRPTQVHLGTDPDGKEIYQNLFFKGAPGDLANLIGNIKDYGAVEGLFRTMGNKASPVVRTGVEALKNQTFLGREIAPKGMNPVASTVRGAYEAGKSMAPIPWAFGNVEEMLFGPEAYKYKKPLEVITTLLAGTPPVHVSPAKAARPSQSIWEQIRSGKVATPKEPSSKPPNAVQQMKRQQRRELHP